MKAKTKRRNCIKRVNAERCKSVLHYRPSNPIQYNVRIIGQTSTNPNTTSRQSCPAAMRPMWEYAIWLAIALNRAIASKDKLTSPMYKAETSVADVILAQDIARRSTTLSARLYVAGYKVTQSPSERVRRALQARIPTQHRDSRALLPCAQSRNTLYARHCLKPRNSVIR